MRPISNACTPSRAQKRMTLLAEQIIARIVLRLQTVKGMDRKSTLEILGVPAGIGSAGQHRIENFLRSLDCEDVCAPLTVRTLTKRD